MSHKNDGNSQSQGGGSQQSGNSTRGGTPEQHAKAGSQSHKNDNKRSDRYGWRVQARHARYTLAASTASFGWRFFF
jgi:hypothetical protein